MSRYLIVALAITAVLTSLPADTLYAQSDTARTEDPLIWEEDINTLIQSTPSKPGDVLFMGSSSIRFWDTLARDMVPLGTVKRGFGGAKLGDALYYADRLVAVDDPAAIVIFVGTNDITPGAAKAPQVLLQSYRDLITKIRGSHAKTPIYYIAITPSILRWEVWPIAEKTNQLIQQFVETDATLQFIDTGPSLMRDGQPNEDNYVRDGLHLSESGYGIWTEIIRFRLMEDLAKASPILK
jgi:lysophospholipase L1-like esterase